MVNIFVGHALLDKSMEFARGVVASYLAGKKESSRNLGIKQKVPIYSDVQTQYVGRVGEVATCLYLELDPIKTLDWNANRLDPGYDITLKNHHTIDVKSTAHPNATRLIWPLTKMRKLPFAADIFVFAKVLKKDGDKMGQIVQLVGCVAKQRFIDQKIVARAMPGLVDGTPYMPETSLDAMEKLLQFHRDQNHNQKER